MLTLRKSSERGHFDHGWLNTYHTFSFADYHDPAHMGFRSLRVINEDTVAPGEGFGMHGHRDMEIITYVIEGELTHKDSMGNRHLVKPGEVQAMSAGTGIMHSEFNASKGQAVHLLQIWIMPRTKGVTPSYAEWYPAKLQKNIWTLTVSGDGTEGSAHIHQDARLYLGVFDKQTTLKLPLAEGRYGWLQVAECSAAINGTMLNAGDGASFAAGDVSEITADAGSTLLLFDLA